ncbi:CD209 antigen-like isoform X2 [Ctenopharyngodon idella]|uniref:CD209 antigen-like isoform X2 n=1 Tax=Ctenopharyngodon idella TaxID=7959 RepID=UPI0022316EEA|nr:CD209 antigen-like isoform X2 [Ctenopharyngodon idella]
MKSGRYTLNTVTGGTTEPLCQDEGKARVCRGSRCLVLMTVCLGLICVLLLVFIIVKHISITAERESLFKSYKNTVEEFNQTINSLQDENTELMNEKDQMKNSSNSLSQKKREPQTSAKDLTAEKSQLQDSSNSLSQTNLELETRVKDLTDEKSQLQNSFNSLRQKKLELETRVNDLTAEKSQLQGSVGALNKKKQELESKVTSLSKELEKDKSKRGNLSGPVCLFKSNESKSWSESRQYCRDHGGDLVIINTEEKQRFISSLVKEFVWIGLSDFENEGNMKWVDNSPLKQGFWEENEPNDAGGKEDCIELNPGKTVLNNWNDIPCSAMRKSVCFGSVVNQITKVEVRTVLN